MSAYVADMPDAYGDVTGVEVGVDGALRRQARWAGKRMGVLTAAFCRDYVASGQWSDGYQIYDAAPLHAFAIGYICYGKATAPRPSTAPRRPLPTTDS
jgi:hypothetical protein